MHLSLPPLCVMTQPSHNLWQYSGLQLLAPTMIPSVHVIRSDGAAQVRYNLDFLPESVLPNRWPTNSPGIRAGRTLA